MKRVPVAVLGATGVVGQRFVQLLENHPWFEIVALSASERNVGVRYGRACPWRLSTPIPRGVAELPIQSPARIGQVGVGLVFSALPSDVARDVEPILAEAGLAVSSNASAFRHDPDVPLVVPEINPQHTSLIASQRERRGWGGFVVTNPNCTTTGIALVLKPLDDAFGLRTVVATTMQAVSGAGYPGVPSLDAIDNVVPFIEGEEEKIEREPRILLGTVEAGRKEEAPFRVSAHANRVPVVDGHTVCLSLGFEQPVSPQRVTDALASFEPACAGLALPSAPAAPIVVREEAARPQPRFDREAGGGMSVSVGRVRPCSVHDVRLLLVVHNTVRGAAGGSILNGELLVAQGFVR
jgi:aspartate-semialdehyde dehydrogenase